MKSSRIYQQRSLHCCLASFCDSTLTSKDLLKMGKHHILLADLIAVSSAVGSDWQDGRDILSSDKITWKQSLLQRHRPHTCATHCVWYPRFPNKAHSKAENCPQPEVTDWPSRSVSHLPDTKALGHVWTAGPRARHSPSPRCPLSFRRMLTTLQKAPQKHGNEASSDTRLQLEATRGECWKILTC